MTEENSVQNAPVVKKTSGMGVAALVLGIVGIVGSWIPILNNISAFIALLGAIFGIIGIVSVSKSKGAKGGKGLAIAGTVVSVVAIVVVLATQSMYGKAVDEASQSWQETSKELNKATGEATDEILGKEVSVDFGTYTVDSETKGSYTSKEGYLAVTVKNLTSEAKSYSIHMEAVDGSGNRIQDDYIYENSLAAGQSKSEKIFNSYTEETVSKYDGATFKIVEVSQY